MSPSTTAWRRIRGATLVSAIALTTGFTDTTTAKKTSLPDPCVSLLGQARYDDPTSNGLVTPVMNWSTDSLGTRDPVSGTQQPLCNGYTYVVILASADGSSLGWKEDTANTRVNARGTANADGTTVTFSLRPTDAATYLVAGGTTNVYLARPATCAPELGVYVSARITDPSGIATYWPSNTDPTRRKLLCELPPGVVSDGYFYG